MHNLKEYADLDDDRYSVENYGDFLHINLLDASKTLALGVSEAVELADALTGFLESRPEDKPASSVYATPSEAAFKNAVSLLAELAKSSRIDISISTDGDITLFDADTERQTGRGLTPEAAFNVLQAKRQYLAATSDWI